MKDKVKAFNEKMKTVHKTTMPTSARMLDIQSELGELNKEYLVGSKYGTKPFIVSEDFQMEYGDVLYALLSLAEELDIDTDKCLEKSIAKLESRLSKKNNMGSN